MVKARPAADPETDAAEAALIERLGANVRRLRAANGETQESVAHAADVATALLQRVEADRANVTLGTLARLARGLGVDPSELLAPLPAKRAKR